jgi:hypothetical protein
MSPEKRKLEGQPSESLPEEQSMEAPHTLEEFSYLFFRCHPTRGFCREAWWQVQELLGFQGKGEPGGTHGREGTL